MKPRRRLPAIVVCLSLAGAQSPNNSLHYGLVADALDASAGSLGHGGLVPSHSAQVSLVNPVTWTAARFTLLTGHYSGGDVSLDRVGYRSSFGRLTYAGIILPIMDRWAFGLGVRPYSRKDFLLEDDSDSTVVFSGDTLTFSKSLEGSGGISSLFMGGSWEISDRVTVGIRWDVLMGVFNEDIAADFSQVSTVYRRHFEVKGTLLSLFARTPLWETPVPAVGFGMVQVPVGGREIQETDFYPFRPTDLRKTVPGPVHPLTLPTRLGVGLDARVSDRLWASLEFYGAMMKPELSPDVSSLGGDFSDDLRVSLGFMRSADRSAESALDRLHYRVGFFERQHYISRRTETLQERGLGIGLGIPFGPTENQVDLAFRFSSRDGFLSGETEIVRQLTVGLTLGDVWLVKGKRR